MSQTNIPQHQQTAVALLRITLGIIILATWYDNLRSGLYTADGLTGFFNWLFDPQNGNGSSLGWYKGILDTAVIPIASLFAIFQLITEFIMGAALLLGILSRLFGLAAMLFFGNLFLAYFGGQEWIWVYVLLIVSAFVVVLAAAGRHWGVDRLLMKSRGNPRLPILW
jgi:uncharacterized membrane protein YphA (DoxX/SURF4 family)